MEGWICYKPEDQAELREMGVTLVGIPKKECEAPEMWTQDCSMSLDTFNLVHPFWGKFIWGLKVKEY